MKKFKLRSSVVAIAVFGMASVMTGCGGGSSTPAATTSAPSVSAVSPVDGTTDNLASSNFSVTFDVPMTVTSITTNITDGSCTGSLQVSKDNFTSCVQMSAAPVASVGDTVFTITPKSGLSFSASYELKVTSAVTEATSNVAMASDYISTTGISIVAYGDDLYPIDGVNDGFAFLELPGVNVYSQASATDSLGRIVHAGYDSSSSVKIFVTRFTADGKLDLSFNSTGSYSQLIGKRGYIRGVEIDSQERIIVVGFYEPSSTIYGGAFINRFNVDGTPDLTFGTNGQILIQNPSASTDYNDDAGAVVVDANDNVIVCGDGYNAGYPLWIKRLNAADGSVDTSFGTSGLALNDISNAYRYNRCHIIRIDQNQNIVIGGHVYQNQVAPYDVEGVIWRFTSAGVLDTSFNDVGYRKFVNLSGDTLEYVQHLEFDSLNNIAASGYSMGTDGAWNTFVSRITPAGALDSSFNGTGMLLLDHPYQSDLSVLSRSLVIDNTDGIILGGYMLASSTDSAATVFRVDNAGLLDTTYGAGDAAYDGSGFLIYNDIVGSVGMGDVLTEIQLNQTTGQITTGGYSMGPNGFYGVVSMKLF